MEIFNVETKVILRELSVISENYRYIFRGQLTEDRGQRTVKVSFLPYVRKLIYFLGLFC